MQRRLATPVVVDTMALVRGHIAGIIEQAGVGVLHRGPQQELLLPRDPLGRELMPGLIRVDKRKTGPRVFRM